MNPKLNRIQKTIEKTEDYWNKYTQTTNKLDEEITEYLKLNKEEVQVTSHNNKIEINFKNVPTTREISQLLYLSKTLGFKFKRYSLTNYAMTTPQ